MLFVLLPDLVRCSIKEMMLISSICVFDFILFKPLFNLDGD